MRMTKNNPWLFNNFSACVKANSMPNQIKWHPVGWTTGSRLSLTRDFCSGISGMWSATDWAVFSDLANKGLGVCLQEMLLKQEH